MSQQDVCLVEELRNNNKTEDNFRNFKAVV